MESRTRSQVEVVDGVASLVVWWVTQRRRKLLELRHETHAVNPFLWPLTMAMHGHTEFRELAQFQLGGHLVEGHATGFGKLIDEKVLPGVFGTTKLDARYRKSTTGYATSAFDNIDHVLPHASSAPTLLSLKAGRWSIQLGQAVQLNRSLQVLLRQRDEGALEFERIVIGVFYGKPETLTDKYAIICGLPTRAVHDVMDISEHVDIHVGRSFWAWLNGGEPATDEWVLEGVAEGYRRSVEADGSLAALFEAFIDDYARVYARYFHDGGADWRALLREVNG